MKTLIGKVISTKMTKAAIVQIDHRYRHPLFGKIVNKKSKIHAANTLGAKLGDTVSLKETRPIAKTISFTIAAIVPSSEVAK